MTKVRFCSDYTKVGNRLTSNNVRLLISERKHPTQKKPKHFLLLIDKEGKKKQYISSLYAVTPSTYKFDYKGIDYLLTFGNRSTIAKIIKKLAA